MLRQITKIAGLGLFLSAALVASVRSGGQEPGGPPLPNPIEKGRAEEADPAVPKGVEVLARGPVHEAFATPMVEPKATPLIGKKPPEPIEEMPPEEKPEGDVMWIRGYWAWDDESNNFLWVSGCWRAKPPGKEWIAGYWRENAGQWQWVPGFWTAPAQAPAQGQGGQTQARTNEVTYYPEPPAPPQVAPPGEPPNVNSFYIPGYYVWQGERYAWRAGYWTRVQPGYVWIPSHYRWTPFGYVFVAGYWDMAVPRRGILYAPVAVDVVVVGPRFVYTPAYAVCDTVVLDSLFVRPAYCHYYFGDYYGPAYGRAGYVSCVVYSRHYYEPVVVYGRWEHRDNPRWHETQITLVLARDAGRAPRPPRTLVQQRTNVTNITNVRNVTNVNNTVLAPARSVAAARGQKTVALDANARTQVKQAAVTAQQTAIQQRRQTETASPGATLSKPRVASLNVPHPAPTGLPNSGARTTSSPDPKSGGAKSATPGGNHPPAGQPPSKNGPGATSTQPLTGPGASTPGKGPAGPGTQPGISGSPTHPPRPGIGPMPPASPKGPPAPPKGPPPHDDRRKKDK